MGERMLNKFTRLADEYLGTRRYIDIPASMRKDNPYDVCVIAGSFAKDSWKVHLGINPVVRTEVVLALYVPVQCVIVYDPQGPLAAPSGKKTFTNSEVMNLFSEICRQHADWTPKEQESMIASFEKKAHICGWTEEAPASPAAKPAAAPKSPYTLG
jgi:hypothetical protein